MAGPISAKNYLLSPASSDLFAGDTLTQNLQNQLEERRKKLLAAAKGQSPLSTVGGAALDLGLTPSV